MKTLKRSSTNAALNKASKSDLRKLSSFLQKRRKKAVISLRQFLTALGSRTMTQEPLEIVLSFIKEMNEWEHKMYLVDRVESGGVINHATDRNLVPNISAEEFKNKYYDIFNRYCTNKKRKYGGFPSGWSRNGQYNGAERSSVVSIKDINKNRTEVVIKGGLFPDNQFLFVVLRKGEDWRIDSAKYGGEDDWDIHHL